MILYDNSKRAAAEIVNGGKRPRSTMFAKLRSHYLFEGRCGRPGKGNDKGKVEGLVSFVRRNFMTPMLVADSFDVFNVWFLDACTKRRRAILRGHRTTISERMQTDMAAFINLPAPAYGACDKFTSPGLILAARTLQELMITRCRRPTVIDKFWRRDMSIRVEIVCRDETIAMQPRSYESADFICKTQDRVLDHAAPQL